MGAASRFAAKAAAKAASKAAAKAEGKAARLAVNPKPRLALPAPPKPLALPAPGPGLPSFAAKPRGGQFYPDVPLRPRDAQAAGYKLENYTSSDGLDQYQVMGPDGEPLLGRVAGTPENAWLFADAHFRNRNPENNMSPEAAARMARNDYGLNQSHGDPTLGSWLERALAKYYKTDFGSPNDPLRELAERGMHFDPEMTPERWQQNVNASLLEDPIGYFTVPRHENEIRAQFAGGPEGNSFYGSSNPVEQGALMQAAPWLRKQPVTDKLYGVRDSLDLGHFVDEMYNALQPEGSGLPVDLAVRPESLDRMTFAQAAEHVGKINRFRAKEMERVSLSRLNSPAVQTFKEYADDNPMGLRWAELKAPDPETYYNLQEVDEGRGKFWRATDPDTGEVFPLGGTREQALESLGYTARGPLQDALKYEGDTMGHCVGGYCENVASGRSRIFSLRDAKGEPHVTIETRPGDQSGAYHQAIAEMRDTPLWNDWLDHQRTSDQRSNGGSLIDYMNAFREGKGLPNLDVITPADIIQIKGKQNAAPKDDYLPFVQDFVKTQQWGNVGDLGNAQLKQLPDGRFITQQQYDEVAARMMQDDPALYQPHNIWREDWETYAPYFEGYAIGGRVSADRCFSKGKSAVYAVNKSRK